MPSVMSIELRHVPESYGRNELHSHPVLLESETESDPIR